MGLWQQPSSLPLNLVDLIIPSKFMFQIVFQGLRAGALRILWKKSLRSGILLASQDSRMSKGRVSYWWLLMVITFDLLPLSRSATEVELWNKDKGFFKGAVMYQYRWRPRMKDPTPIFSTEDVQISYRVDDSCYKRESHDDAKQQGKDRTPNKALEMWDSHKRQKHLSI